MQKEGDGNEVKDSIADFGMYVSESPFKGNAFGANEKCKAFIDYLRKSGMMKMYCDFNKIGRQHVRLKSIDPDLYRYLGNEDLLVLSITFKINDPVTDIKPIMDAQGRILNLG